MPLEVLANHLQRVLLYVHLANSGGYYPTAAELDRYAMEKEPDPPVRQNVVLSAMRSIGELQSWHVTEGRPVAHYMRLVSWVQHHDSGGLQLTALGAALVRGLGAEGSQRGPEDRGVILRNDDPARYEVLIRTLARAKAGLLADPYLREDVLNLLADGTSLGRLLLSSRVPREERTLIALTLGRLAESDPDRQLEVRVSEDKRFHDRYLLHEDGSLDLIGASVNSLDTRITAVVPLAAALQHQARDLVEEFWSEAVPIEPRDTRRPDNAKPV